MLDPFSGSGTTLLVAAEEGRQAIGIDRSPLAICLSRAKTEIPDIDVVLDRIEMLRDQYTHGALIEEPLPNGLSAYFHPATLAQIIFLKNALGDDSTDNFIKATIVGILHGRSRGKAPGSIYLSVDMPNTFSMSPGYVGRYVEAHGLRAIPHDAFLNLRRRIDYLLADEIKPVGGSLAKYGDATASASYYNVPRAHLIVTSPPYLGVLKYGAFNWLRLWFLGHEARVVDTTLMSTGSAERYLAFMLSFLSAVYDRVVVGGRLVLLVGDLANRRLQNLAEIIAKDVVPLSAWHVDRIEHDINCEDSKTTRIWGEGKRGNASRRDDALILTK